MPGSTISYPAGVSFPEFVKGNRHVCTYIHQEAISVKLPTSKQSAVSKPRNHLTDAGYSRTFEDSDSSSSGSVKLTPRIDSYYKETDTASTPKTVARRDPVKASTIFELDLPEHLPSSPICPANAKHKLKGKGACVVS